MAHAWSAKSRSQGADRTVDRPDEVTPEQLRELFEAGPLQSTPGAFQGDDKRSLPIFRRHQPNGPSPWLVQRNTIDR